MITKIDGTIVKCKEDMLNEYIYNDYTNLNIRLLEEYNMDLSIFFNDIPHLDNIIDEIPMDNISIIVDKVGIIIQNTKEQKELIFDIKNIKTFVNLSVELILAKLKELI